MGNESPRRTKETRIRESKTSRTEIREPRSDNNMKDENPRE